MIWKALIPLADGLIDKFFPDKAEAAKQKVRLMEMHQEGQLADLDARLQTALAQAAITQEDAKSHSRFQSWYRPAAAWVCVFGLAYPIITALLAWLLKLISWGWGVDLADFPMPPAIDTGVLVTLLTGMLGLGTMRGVEKHKRMTTWREKNDT